MPPSHQSRKSRKSRRSRQRPRKSRSTRRVKKSKATKSKSRGRSRGRSRSRLTGGCWLSDLFKSKKFRAATITSNSPTNNLNISSANELAAYRPIKPSVLRSYIVSNYGKAELEMEKKLNVINREIREAQNKRRRDEFSEALMQKRNKGDYMSNHMTSTEDENRMQLANFSKALTKQRREGDYMSNQM